MAITKVGSESLGAMTPTSAVCNADYAGPEPLTQEVTRKLLWDKLQLADMLIKLQAVEDAQRNLPMQPTPSTTVPNSPSPPPGLEPPCSLPGLSLAAAHLEDMQPQRAQMPLNLGSVGHPHNCGQPCRYALRRGGCHDGIACPDCHQCQWRRGLPPKRQLLAGSVMASENMPAPEPQPVSIAVGASAGLGPASPAAAPAPWQVQQCAGMIAASSWAAATTPPLCPSVGSIGHPFSCAGPCKFLRKGSGCKDGSLCVRCHLCQWKRHMAKAPHKVFRG
mmetsp:Transcript_23599/g.60274  ORF Transcript_23599/g.60274 Transcript_23599/m.60274 type:complete len:277 (-) Transcript_23599:458-1288(-)